MDRHGRMEKKIKTPGTERSENIHTLRIITIIMIIIILIVILNYIYGPLIIL